MQTPLSTSATMYCVHLSLNGCTCCPLHGDDAMYVCAQAEPLAQEVVETRLKPAAEAIAEQAEPQAQRFNEEVIRPRGQQLAEQVIDCFTRSPICGALNWTSC